jgi:Flp pilus assembly protein TadB
MQNNTRVHQVQENTSVQHTNNQSAQDKTSQQDLNQQVQDNMRVQYKNNQPMNDNKSEQHANNQLLHWLVVGLLHPRVVLQGFVVDLLCHFVVLRLVVGMLYTYVVVHRATSRPKTVTT